jgi:putative inorganic carbon (HCO3(-)) transporter
MVWRGALTVIAAYPLLGVGLGNFQFVYPRVMRPAAWFEPLQYHSHNVFLDFAAFLGLGGLAMFVVLMAVFHHTGQRLLRVLPANQNRALVIGLLAGAIGSLAYGLVDNGYFLPDLACLWALFLGLVDWETTSLTGVEAPDRDRSATSSRHPAQV